MKSAYVLDRFNNWVVHVDLATGNRSVISGRDPLREKPSVGRGIEFINPISLALTKDEKYLYVADERLDGLFRVAVDTGDRKVFSR